MICSAVSKVITIRDLEVNHDYYNTLAHNHSVLLWLVFQNTNKSNLHMTVWENARDKSNVPLPNFRKVPPNY